MLLRDNKQDIFIEIISAKDKMIGSDGHEFCLLGRDQASHIEDPATWGSAIVIDPWAKKLGTITDDSIKQFFSCFYQYTLTRKAILGEDSSFFYLWPEEKQRTTSESIPWAVSEGEATSEHIENISKDLLSYNDLSKEKKKEFPSKILEVINFMFFPKKESISFTDVPLAIRIQLFDALPTLFSIQEIVILCSRICFNSLEIEQLEKTVLEIPAEKIFTFITNIPTRYSNWTQLILAILGSDKIRKALLTHYAESVSNIAALLSLSTNPVTCKASPTTKKIIDDLSLETRTLCNGRNVMFRIIQTHNVVVYKV